jgi:hypothetical protein
MEYFAMELDSMNIRHGNAENFKIRRELDTF